MTLDAYLPILVFTVIVVAFALGSVVVSSLLAP